jgi:hypothetical protein
MNKLSKILTGVAVSALFSAPALAASDGSLGTSSSGQSDVSLTVADRVQITSVADIALGTYSGTGDLVGSTEYCVFRNGGGDYKVTLTTDQGAFEVAEGGGQTIPFTARVDDDLTPADGESLSYGTASSVALVGSNSATCGGTDNGAVEVTFSEANLQAAATTNYSATMTILVEPI